MANKKKKKVVKRKKRVILLNIIYILAFLLCIYFATTIVLNKVNERRDAARAREISDLYKELYNDFYSNKTSLVQELRNVYLNNDIVGIIEIPDLDISTPIVQTDNNTFYLNHLIDRRKARYGSLFVDYRADINFSPLVVIYGHNDVEQDTREELPLRKLNRLLNESVFNRSENIRIITENKTLNFKILALKLSSRETIYPNSVFFSAADFNNYLSILLEDSLYKKNINVNRGSQILVLQTCITDTNDDIDKFLLLIAKRVDNYE